MASPSGPGRRPDASRALAQYRRRAARYDFELLAFEPIRTEAIGLLPLRAGDTVLDVGCGTGLSFAGLQQRIGAQGRILAFDPSPEMLALARERIARHRWDGITLVEASAGHVALQGRADAALFHFTHDVLRDAASLDHVLAHLRPGAGVVASGLQWAPPWLAATNLFVWGAARYSVTCMEGLEAPWDLLAARLEQVEIRTRGFGGIYIASGRVPANAPHRARH
jgi:demethylmenaquinone methyltransferase/2-methoxy-6-polyprenyl-1,4-benzoquinol methylase